MPKPMLNLSQTKDTSVNLLSVTKQQARIKPALQLDKAEIDQMLRKKRSKQYMEALQKLDAGGHVQNQKQVEEIINALKQEFPEVTLSEILLGYVSICYLGKPYEVHTLSFTGQIIEHYKVGQPLPAGLEKARSIAVLGGYEFIEVYVDCLRCVSSSGEVAVIQR